MLVYQGHQYRTAIEGPQNVPWFRVTVDDDSRQWLQAGGRALLDKHGSSAPAGNEWLLPEDKFRIFEVEAENISDGDLDPYWVDEMWDWDEVQHLLLRWGYR